MELIIHFSFGFLVAFIGSITPSMLNMTALKMRLQNNTRSSYRYILGVSLVVLLQTYIAVILSKYIIENPTVLEMIEKVGVFIFIILSVYFYKESKKEKSAIGENQQQQKRFFLTGITLSSLNMFAIPFFCGVVAFLDVFKLFRFDGFSVAFFILGAGFGTYSILFLYVKYAHKIQKKTGKLTKDITLVLSILTALVALLSIVKIAYKIIIT
jgi:threonine/homoserine/homoserine lactone efflux protein